MSRLILICWTVILIGISAEQASSVRPRTALLYAQAFRDGFWRGLAGDLAVVTYKPVRKGKLVYYYQIPHYFSKHHGYSTSYAHSHGHGHHVHHEPQYAAPHHSHALHHLKHVIAPVAPAYPATSYGYPQTHHH